jgi:hypothetical protein
LPLLNLLLKRSLVVADQVLELPRRPLIERLVGADAEVALKDVQVR